MVSETEDSLMETNLKDDRILNGLCVDGSNGQCIDATTPCIDMSLSEESVDDESEVTSPFVYNISQKPPIHLMLFFGFQQAIISIAHQLVVSMLVAEVCCASNDGEIKARLLSSTLFMTGLTTFLMVTLGIRLPVFQGAAIEYLSPLLLLATVDSTFCEATSSKTMHMQLANSTLNITNLPDRERITTAITTLQGSLMIAGVFHTLIGATGLVGILLRFIGPITIIPTVLLIGLYMIKATAKFVIVQLPVAVITASVTLILSLYLGRMKTPIPFWSPGKGCRIIRFPFHQVFAILIGMFVGILTCAIMTAIDYVPNDPSDPHYRTRTDARTDILEKANWFTVPYPGQFGMPSLSASALVGCLLATMLSILDSVGDYFACAKTCLVPPPPRHAVNRGLAVEGFCAFLSGAVGCGHGTTTYAGNIGAMGLTRVASRWVFVAVGCIYMLFGIVGKFSAVFILIPEPVMGGALISITACFIGVILSNLNEISMKSSRNMSILGLSLLVGLMVPSFVHDYPDLIETDNLPLKNFLKMFFGNANFAGALCAFILDNTVPGTKEERGILAWTSPPGTGSVDSDYLESDEIYKPWMPSVLKSSNILKYIPFLPDPESDKEAKKYRLERGDIEL